MLTGLICRVRFQANVYSLYYLFMKYMRHCGISWHVSILAIMRIFVLHLTIIMKSYEIWIIISYCIRFGHEKRDALCVLSCSSLHRCHSYQSLRWNPVSTRYRTQGITENDNDWQQPCDHLCMFPQICPAAVMTPVRLTHWARRRGYGRTPPGIQTHTRPCLSAVTMTSIQGKVSETRNPHW